MFNHINKHHELTNEFCESSGIQGVHGNPGGEATLVLPRRNIPKKSCKKTKNPQKLLEFGNVSPRCNV